ncbi:hypothetical protein FOZ61_003153 [Perkinsus olseni]|uniref:Uncharacterized protein n=1 Tax=Perkinsus olseni TaxID=32597 RepID=A0A7J6LQB2_PEROL|nr:hypothetical protein FOZ61_003153 [Perkinsus olseni]
MQGFCQAPVFHYAGASQGITAAFDHSKVFDYIYGTQSVHFHHVDPLLILTAADPKIDVFNWAWYFNEVLRGGARNLLLTGYMVDGNKIVPSIFQHKARDDSGFTTLRDARKFLETYPVDGFLVHFGDFNQRKILIMQGLTEAFKELGRIFMTKCDYFKWHRALETEVPQTADLNVVVLKPNVHRNVSAEGGMFLTDANAEKVLSDAYKAGVREEKLILEVDDRRCAGQNPQLSGYLDNSYCEDL